MRKDNFIIFLRFVQWRAFMVRRSRRWRGYRDDREQLESVEFQPGTSYKFYYTQDEADQGVIMETNLPTKDVSQNDFYFWFFSFNLLTSLGMDLDLIRFQVKQSNRKPLSFLYILFFLVFDCQ